MGTETQKKGGIVDYAWSHFAPVLSGEPQRRRSSRHRTGIYVDGAEAVITPDGYARRTPVQPVRVAPDYKKRIIKKIIGVFIVCALVALAVYLLFHYNVISI